MAIGGKSRILQFLGILIADYVLTSSFGFPRILLQAFVFKAFPPIYLLYYGIYLLLVFRVLSVRLVILAPIIWILVHRSMKLNSLQSYLQRLSCSQVIWCFILVILIGVIFGVWGLFYLGSKMLPLMFANEMNSDQTNSDQDTKRTSGLDGQADQIAGNLGGNQPIEYFTITVGFIALTVIFWLRAIYLKKKQSRLSSNEQRMLRQLEQQNQKYEKIIEQLKEENSNIKQKESQNLKEEFLCKICLVQKCEFLGESCKHLVSCSSCYEKLGNQCPVCRAKTKFNKIYI